MLLKDVGKTPAQIKELVNKYMIETYVRFDFIVEKADGTYMYDEEGNKYLDFYGGIAVNSTGSCHPAVVKAVQEQVSQVIHTFNYPYTIPQALLAEKVCNMVGMDKIFFQNSGTEANEAMIKMARKYGIDKYGENRYHIVTAKKSFHGRTFGALTATGQPGTVLHNNFGPLVPGFSYAEFNNVQAFRDAVTPDTIAIMLEPVQGEGGVWPATDEFMAGIAELCKEKGLLLLMDEIQTGFYRTGPVMGFMNFGLKPDIISMAKAIGGGMPIGAVCASDEVATVFAKGTHGTTYGGNPVACAAAVAQCTVMTDENYEQKVNEMSPYIMDRLRKMDRVVDVRGKGLLIGAQLDGPIGAAVKKICIERKLLVNLIGDSILRLLPPLNVSKDDVDTAMDIIEAAIKEV